MRELNVNVKDLTYYLVSLFYKTNCKYSCTVTKISKILSILAFKYASEGILLFDDEIRKYDNCGTIIKNSAFWVYLDEYKIYECLDNKEYIKDEIKEPINLTSSSLERYRQVCNDCNLPIYIKNQVEELFRYFGAYSQNDLSEVLNPIVDKLTTESYGVVDLSKISTIIETTKTENDVVEYIKLNLNDKRKIKVI